jgi:sirohydrochlorin cobaltochelatase
MHPRLDEAVRELADGGCTEVVVVPVFLAQAGHLIRDLPRLVEDARRRHPALSIRVAGAVGEDAQVLQAIARYCVSSV